MTLRWPGFVALFGACLVSRVLAMSRAHGQREDHRRLFRPFLDWLGPATTHDDPTALKLLTVMQGDHFFDHWDFFTEDDPTEGLVEYVDRNRASPHSLAYINPEGHAVVGVDAWKHMPTGCSVWPALWTFGPDWPNDGEIDIAEGINLNTRNQMTLHTGEGCMLRTPMQATGSIMYSTDCYAYADENKGCGVQERQENSYGTDFNQHKGGTWVMYWTNDGIKIWFFPQGAGAPPDLQRGQPVPSLWGLPSAYFDSSTCDADKYFSNQTIVINTTLCGAWAGNPAEWPSQCGDPCEEWVRHGKNYEEAYWEIESVRVYEPFQANAA